MSHLGMCVHIHILYTHTLIPRKGERERETFVTLQYGMCHAKKEGKETEIDVPQLISMIYTHAVFKPSFTKLIYNRPFWEILNHKSCTDLKSSAIWHFQGVKKHNADTVLLFYSNKNETSLRSKQKSSEYKIPYKISKSHHTQNLLKEVYAILIANYWSS